jgi:hypothetical protein
MLNGNGGNDSVLLDDHLNTAGTSYNFDAGDVLRGLVDCSLFESAELRSGTGDDTVNVNAVSLNLSLLTGDGNDSVLVQDSDAFVTVDTGGETPGPNNNVGDSLVINSNALATNDVGSLVRIKPGSHDILRQLRISSFNGTSVGVCQIPADTTLEIPDAFNPIALNGILDLAGGAFVYHGAAAQQQTFRGFIQNGYANGSWDGYGIGQDVINSSLAHQTAQPDAVGYAAASDIYSSFPANFAGVSVNSNDLLIGYMLAADANFSGATNALDFNALASHFGSTNQNWAQGNFNYDFDINTLDFNVLAMSFNQTLPAPSATQSAKVSIVAPTLQSLFGNDRIEDLAELVL